MHRRDFLFAPPSGHGRSQWQSRLIELSSALCLYHGAGSLCEAMAITPSDASAYFASNAFEKHRSWTQAVSKVQVAVVDRLNGVIRGLGQLARRFRGKPRPIRRCSLAIIRIVIPS